jgi:RES domain-containing protein
LTQTYATRVYRVLRRAFAQSPLDGEGAFRYGGRWSSAGTRLAYTSEHQSLAMLEYFVHLNVEDAPADLVLLSAEIPGDLPSQRVGTEQLPPFWRRSPAPPELARIGDEFVRKAEGCILVVPSALAPKENNWLLNPQHASFRKIMVSGIEPLTYDPRMFGGRRRTHGKR